MRSDIEGNGKSLMPWSFDRGLCNDFIAELSKLAEKPTWFQDVILDEDLIIGIRKNYLNVYMNGQSVFNIAWNSKEGMVGITTHPKYLVDPALSKQVVFDGEKFSISSLRPLLEKYEVGKSLERMKKSAARYGGLEKRGLHKIFRGSPNAVDLEIALSRSAETNEFSVGEDVEVVQEQPKKPTAPRIDIACFEEINSKIVLSFWEAKEYSNSALWASGGAMPPAIGQVSGYRVLIEKYRADIIRSYKTVARNLVALATMGEKSDKVGPLIARVASGEEFSIAEPAGVGVIVFGFSSDEKAGARHKAMKKAFEGNAAAFVARGKPGDIRIG